MAVPPLAAGVVPGALATGIIPFTVDVELLGADDCVGVLVAAVGDDAPPTVLSAIGAPMLAGFGVSGGASDMSAPAQAAPTHAANASIT